MARIELRETSNRIIKKWFAACSVFFKIMIPVSLIIKILEETGLMQYVGYALSPLMQPLGLPGEMGLVWAATMLSNIYGGLLSLSSLQPEGGMTVAQITTLSSLMLFAHTFLIEIPICVKAGCRFIPIFLIRFVSAYLFAFLTAQICMRFSLCDSPISAIHFTETSSSWVGWAIGEVKKYVSIALIVLSLVVLLELLERIGFLRLLEKVLSPVVGFIGISPNDHWNDTRISLWRRIDCCRKQRKADREARHLSFVGISQPFSFDNRRSFAHDWDRSECVLCFRSAIRLFGSCDVVDKISV